MSRNSKKLLKHKGNKKIVEHDKIHWQQYKRMGFLWYYFRWVFEMIWFGYDKSPMEIEARANEDEYTKQNYSKVYHKKTKKII